VARRSREVARSIRSLDVKVPRRLGNHRDQASINIRSSPPRSPRSGANTPVRQTREAQVAPRESQRRHQCDRSQSSLVISNSVPRARHAQAWPHVKLRNQRPVRCSCRTPQSLPPPIPRCHRIGPCRLLQLGTDGPHRLGWRLNPYCSRPSAAWIQLSKSALRTGLLRKQTAPAIKA